MRLLTSPDRIARTSRVAFTLVELLVVIAIIGILVSLLLPAVNSARDAARKIMCANNMRQVGLAVIQYENSYKHLPVAGLVGPPGQDTCRFNDDCFDPRTGQQIGWIPLILPFMEEQALFDDFDFRQTIFEQQRLPQSRHIATLTCPSDSADSRFLRHALTNDIPFAKGNIAAFVSPMHVGHLEFTPGALGGFTPGETKGQPMKRLTDGTSKTIVVTEVLTRDEESDQRGTWALPWAAATVLALDVHHDTFRCPTGVSLARDISLIDPYCARHGDYWQSVAQLPNRPWAGPGDAQSDTLYACLNFDPKLPCRLSSWLSAPPRSHHIGGVNAFMLDGRVSFVSDEVDHVTMAYLISINDGQVLDYTDQP